MDASLITALAALVGAAIGGFTSLAASWLTQRTQVHAQWTSQQILRRQDLYKEFIEQASKCYVHALQQHEPDIAGLVELYARLNRMRMGKLVFRKQSEIKLCRFRKADCKAVKISTPAA